VKTNLLQWYEEMLASNYEPMKRTVSTLKRWQTEFFNRFVYHDTNGSVEGLNNKTKVIEMEPVASTLSTTFVRRFC